MQIHIPSKTYRHYVEIKYDDFNNDRNSIGYV